MKAEASFQFSGSLNDFLPKAKRGSVISYAFSGNPAVKDAIEALGVPHPEVARLEVNQKPENFRYRVKPGDKIEVFPKDLAQQSPEVNYLQPPLPETLGFVLDVHLGKLAKSLRMLGFDTLYRNDYTDLTIAGFAETERRIVLTRDVDLLKIKTINWGYWLRSQFLKEQLPEVIRYFGLENKFAPFTRCLACNGTIQEVMKEVVYEQLPPNTRRFFSEFYQCQHCRKVYWKGSHFERMKEFIRQFQTNSHSGNQTLVS